MSGVHRVNIERTTDGLRVCWGAHHRSAGCEWVYYAVRHEAERLKLELAQVDREASLHRTRIVSILWALPPNTLVGDVQQWERDYRAHVGALEALVLIAHQAFTNLGEARPMLWADTATDEQVAVLRALLESRGLDA